MIKIVIFGATGSIGSQVIDVISKNNQYQLVGFSYYKNTKNASNILKKFSKVYCYSENESIYNNVSSYEELINRSNPDIIINAITGCFGLKITMLALNYNNKTLLLANKESIVLAGNFIKKIAMQNNINIIPIDSEHTSLYFLLKSYNWKKIDKLYITASGGNFYKKNLNDLGLLKYENVISHPTWKMGEKISIDSSTLINKCFEIIEVYFYFETDKIVALYHPQSLVHSIIEFCDNSVVLHACDTDMRWSIDQALSNFESDMPIINKLDFKNLDFHFETINENKWKPIKWAYEFLETKNYNIGLIICVCDEFLIEKFRQNIISYNDIVKIINKYLFKYKNFTICEINDLYLLINKLRQDLITEYGYDSSS